MAICGRRDSKSTIETEWLYPGFYWHTTEPLTNKGRMDLTCHRSSGSRGGPRGPWSPLALWKKVIKKMAAKGDRIDFMFLGPPLTRPLDPLLHRYPQTEERVQVTFQIQLNDQPPVRSPSHNCTQKFCISTFLAWNSCFYIVRQKSNFQETKS